MIYNQTTAAQAAKALNDGELNGWSYEAVCLGGIWQVQALDERGAFVGFF